MVPCGTLWYLVVPCGTLWYLVVPVALIRNVILSTSPPLGREEGREVVF